MKTFLITTLVLLLIAIFTSISVFFYLQNSFKNDAKDSVVNVKKNVMDAKIDNADGSGDNSSSSVMETEVSDPTDTGPTLVTEESGIPLRDLPLSDTQVSLVESVGIDVETYEITPETINCAKDKLGEDRFLEIVDGNSPSGFEMVKLIPCL